MNIVILHYHLNRGGVGQVIRHHLRALDLVANTGPSRVPLRVLLLYGGRCENWPEGFLESFENLEVQMVAISELDYAPARAIDAGKLTQQLLSELRRNQFEPSDSVIHAHNHALGKNAAVTMACRALARQGYAMLLQIHDFAEDFRLDVYQALAETAQSRSEDPGQLMYPQASHIHYIVLNHRDYRILQGAGVANERLHLFPNPVTPLPLRQPTNVRTALQKRWGISRDSIFVLYPVRAIRRKNLGELLLWSAALRGRASFGTTLPPMEPAEQPRYARWKQLTRRLGLECYFELGMAEGWSFSDNMHAADRLVTTSVAEGFGMVFLESWLEQRLLVGRDLPEITANPRQAGVKLQSLYSEMLIPAGWLDWPSFVNCFCGCCEEVSLRYGRDADTDAIHAICDEWRQRGLIDFAFLPVAFQEDLITSVHDSGARREELLELNPQLRLSEREADTALIRDNAEVIADQFSLERCGQRLGQLYERATASTRDNVCGLARDSAVLDAFLDFRRFHPLRIEP